MSNQPQNVNVEKKNLLSKKKLFQYKYKVKTMIDSIGLLIGSRGTIYQSFMWYWFGNNLN